MNLIGNRHVQDVQPSAGQTIVSNSDIVSAGAGLEAVSGGNMSFVCGLGTEDDTIMNSRTHNFFANQTSTTLAFVKDGGTDLIQNFGHS